MTCLFSLLAEFQFFPDQGSDLARQVDGLFLTMVGVTGSITFAIAVVIVFFITKYRRSNPNVNRALGSRSSLPAEITWTVIPLCTFIGMFAWGTNIYFQKSQVPRDAMEVQVVLVQTVDLMNSLPKYRANIEAKWTTIRRSGRVSDAVRYVSEEPCSGKAHVWLVRSVDL